MDRIEKNMVAPRMVFPMPNEVNDGASFGRNVKVAAETYDDLAAILKQFADTANKLHAVPDGLFTNTGDPTLTPFPGMR